MAYEHAVQKVARRVPIRIPTLPPPPTFLLPELLMNRRDFFAALPAAVLASRVFADDKLTPAKIGPNDWPWWRGPTRDGVAATQTIPLEWAAEKNILWQTDVPGRGHGAAIVVGDRVFL